MMHKVRQMYNAINEKVSTDVVDLIWLRSQREDPQVRSTSSVASNGGALSTTSSELIDEDLTHSLFVKSTWGTIGKKNSVGPIYTTKSLNSMGSIN